jgi:putative ABC transport system permease protein
MKASSRSLTGRHERFGLRRMLVVSQVALSLVLLVGCSLLARSYLRMQAVTLAVAPNQMLTLRVPLSARRYAGGAKRAAFFSAVLDRLAAAPGVMAAGLNTGLHPLGNMWTTVSVAGGVPVPEPVVVHQINAGYQSAIGVRPASGRLLEDADVRLAARVAVVNDRFVHTHLAGRPPLGQIAHLPEMRQAPVNLQDDSFQIVGVVPDMPNQGLARPVMPEIYVPFTIAGMADRLVLRTGTDAGAITRMVIDQIHAVDPDQPVDEAKRLDVVLAEDEYATPRFSLVLFLIFGTLGLVLAVVGVYGVMSTAVAQQRHEIGVRMALGAGRSRIVRMIVARGARLLIAGVVVGLVASVVAARAIAGQVWNVAAFDPTAFAIVALILFAAGLWACFWPARRAGRIDPMVALRTD